MNPTQSPITVPAESRRHMTPAALALAVAIASMGVAMWGDDAPAPSQPQRVSQVQVVGYMGGV